MKKGFTLVELVICISIIIVIGVMVNFAIFNDKSSDKTLSKTERVILEAAQLLVDIDYDTEGSNYKDQLYLGAQGVQISLNKLLKEGLIGEKEIDNLHKELLKKDASITKEEILKYYILILNGSLDEKYKEEPCNGMLTYYLSWQNDFADEQKDVFLCGNLPDTVESGAAIKVSIREKNGYNDWSFKLLGENNNEITANDGEYLLNYGKKYYVKFSESVYDESDSIDFNKFNQDNNYVYITLEDIEKYEDGEGVIKYYDLSKYFKSEPQNSTTKLLIDELKNNVFKNALNSDSKLKDEGKFKTIATDTDSGYYVYEDFYFYRGNIKNNYVLFGGFLWKILHTNSNGSIRLILDGDIGSSTWGYESTNFGDSNVKQKLDEWYNENLNSYSNYMSVYGFCEKNATNLTSTNPIPNLWLSGITYNTKIGLITADEMIFAGAALNSSNLDYYLSYLDSFWTMTPYSGSSFDYVYASDTVETGGGDGCVVWEGIVCCPGQEGLPEDLPEDAFSGGDEPTVDNYSVLSETSKYSTHHIRPVINLKSDVKFYVGGTGIYANPYVIDTSA